MSPAAPEIAIVVPVRNRETLLPRCLESIRKQTYRPIHLIVVDNDSTDASREVARQWAIANHRPDFRITVVDETRIGASAARNRGLAEVDAPIVVFFDSDDAMRPELAQICADTFAAHPDAQIVAWHVALHSPRGVSVLHAPTRPLMRSQILHSALRTHGYAVRTGLLKAVGAWNETLPLWNDWELGIRLLLSNPNIRVRTEVLADIYAHPMSLSGTGSNQRAPLILKAIAAAERAIEKSHCRHSRRWQRLANARRTLLAARLHADGYGSQAQEVLNESLTRDDLNAMHRALLRFIYFYTRTGGRGAASLLAPLL